MKLFVIIIKGIFILAELYLFYKIYLNVSLFNPYLGQALFYMFCAAFLGAFYNGLKKGLNE